MAVVRARVWCAARIYDEASANKKESAASGARADCVRLWGLQVITVAGHHVLETFERAVFAFSRPSNPTESAMDAVGHYQVQEGGSSTTNALPPRVDIWLHPNAGRHDLTQILDAGLQVDALLMEQFIDGFLASLGLENSYTLLVMNPKWSVSLPPYSYRVGFSEQEMRLLAEQVCMWKRHVTKHHGLHRDWPRSCRVLYPCVMQASTISQLTGRSMAAPPTPPDLSASVLKDLVGGKRHKKFQV
jgi:hypothetical protein